MELAMAVSKRRRLCSALWPRFAGQSLRMAVHTLLGQQHEETSDCLLPILQYLDMPRAKLWTLWN
jgi:hypothetical protein